MHDLLVEVRAALGTSTLTPLQQGGQKMVFESQLEGVPVALKIAKVPPGDFADQVVERARREVELLAAIESPFVVRLLSEFVEIGDRPEALCWVEELLDGEDLAAHRSSYPWLPDQVWTLVADTAEGLRACHDLDVVHRDLSPGNVRRRANGRFVLIDPGVARHLTKDALTGVVNPGTPAYMSPEQVPGGRPTPASDVFGLGILAFEALTGQVPVPFQGDDDAYFRQLRDGAAPPIRTVRADVPVDLAKVIDRCLLRQPARRYLDATELIDDLPPQLRATSGAPA
jgi:serine/threonine protein kinase